MLPYGGRKSLYSKSRQGFNFVHPLLLSIFLNSAFFFKIENIFIISSEANISDGGVWCWGGRRQENRQRLHRLWSDLQSATIEIMYQLNEGVGRRSL